MNNSKLRFIIIFFLISIFSILMNQFFFDRRNYLLIPMIIRDLLEISAVLGTAVLGYFHFAKLKIKPLKSLWLLIYGLSFIVLIILALIDNFIFPFSIGGQYRLVTFKSILTGPIIFLVIEASPKLIKF